MQFTREVGDVRMRLFRSRELVERGEMEESARFRPSLADVSGLIMPEPSGDGNSSPSSENADMGRLRSCDIEVGVPEILGKSGDVKACTFPLLVRLSLKLKSLCRPVTKLQSIGSLCFVSPVFRRPEEELELGMRRTETSENPLRLLASAVPCESSSSELLLFKLYVSIASQGPEQLGVACSSIFTAVGAFSPAPSSPPPPGGLGLKCRRVLSIARLHSATCALSASHKPSSTCTVGRHSVEDSAVIMLVRVMRYEQV